MLVSEPNHVYAGLLTVLLRSVFILYAEDRGLLSDDDVYVKHYSLTGLFERLRDDEARYPDTMDQRFGAWAQLLALFRLVHDGGRHGGMRIPPRHGYLFDPDRYPFLEGRPKDDRRVMNTRIEPPMVPDGTVLRVLRNLLVLDGERISYRALDVEQIGSVYETMMGFDLRAATGRSIAVKPAKSHGAPVAVDLDALLRESRTRGASGCRSARTRSLRARRWRRSGAPRRRRRWWRRWGARWRARRRRTSCRPARWYCSPATSGGARGRTTRRARSRSPSCARRCGRCCRRWVRAPRRSRSWSSSCATPPWARAPSW